MIKTNINFLKNHIHIDPLWLIPVALGLLATVILHQHISTYKRSLGYNMDAIEVLITQEALPQYHVLAEDDFDVIKLPRRHVPLGALFSSDARKVTGRAINRPLSKHELVLWSAVDVEYLHTGPASRILEGYRSIAIPVSATTAASQSIRAGDHVDLITNVTISGQDSPTTFTLLQNVTVLSTGVVAENEFNSDSYQTVNLMVLPKEVNLIIQAQNYGQLHLALRNPKDLSTHQKLPMVAKPDVIENAFLNSIQDERNQSIEIIRGQSYTSSH